MMKISSPILWSQRALPEATLTVWILLSAGCGRDNVKVYHVEKDDPASVPPTVAASAAPNADASLTPAQGLGALPQLKWTLPTGWHETAPRQMRVASFAVTDANGATADVGVIPLPAGEDQLALINMWREQMQLPALTNAVASETVSAGNDSAELFDIASDALLIDGKLRARILVAMLTRGDTSWFFKMTGEDSFVAAHKEIFLQFLKSVSFVENAPAQIVAAPATQNENANSVWTIPSGWQQLPPSEFLVAKFLIQQGDTKAEVNISELAGDGGGLLANVNRWRGQIGLPPVEVLTGSIDSGDGKMQIVDFTGTDSKTGKPARLVGAVIPKSSETWFYKLMGNEQTVAQQKDAFIKFIQSANYANAR
jgi:hypothetical protein